jgi:hypothetical protein
MQKLGKISFRTLLLFLFLSNGNSTSVSAQYLDKMPASDTTGKQLVIQPTIGVGIGMLSYIGNVQSSSGNIQNPSNGRVGYTLSISQRLSSVVDFSLNFLYGTVAQNEQTTSAYWNFQSSIAGGGINLMFKVLPKQDICPYFIVGVESYEFQSRADIYDPYGNEYYSWTDGTLRSEPENSAEASSAKILTPDYAYATDIRQLNIAGQGSYTQQTFAVPVGLGFMFRVTEKASFMVGTTVHYAFTSNIDGLTPQTTGPLKNDMFAYTYATLRFNLTRSHPRVRDEYNPLDATMLEDTVHPDVPKTFDTSEAALQMQYERAHDTTGKYSQHIVDSFHWHDPSWNGTGAPPPPTVVAANNNGTNSPAGNNNAASNNNTGNDNNTGNNNANNNSSSGNLANSTNASSDGVVYKVQILSTKNRLAEGISFAGITDKASIVQEDGMYKYTTGNFSQYNDAEKYLTQLKTIGYSDAFIKATKNGKDVAMPSHGQGEGAATNNGGEAPVANNNSSAGAATNSATKSGLVFSVQYGVFSATPDQAFMNMFKKLPNGTVVKDNSGLNHYMAGSYSDLQSAQAAQGKAKAAGQTTVIKAVNNGQIISMDDAKNLLKK